MNFFTHLLINLVRCYKFLLSPLIGNSCRFFPSCSDYSIESLKTFGFFKGLYFSLKRILSCHPWSDGGFDPIKKQTRVKK